MEQATEFDKFDKVNGRKLSVKARMGFFFTSKANRKKCQTSMLSYDLGHEGMMAANFPNLKKPSDC